MNISFICIVFSILFLLNIILLKTKKNYVRLDFTFEFFTPENPEPVDKLCVLYKMFALSENKLFIINGRVTGIVF